MIPEMRSSGEYMQLKSPPTIRLSRLSACYCIHDCDFSKKEILSFRTFGAYIDTKVNIVFSCSIFININLPSSYLNTDLR